MINLICTFLTFFQSAGHAPAGEDADYYQLSREEFFQLQEVQEAIEPGKLDQQLLEAAVFFASNEARSDYNQPVFLHAPSLQRAATRHAGYLKKIGQLEHFNRQERTQRKMGDRVQQAGGDFEAVAENLERIHLLELGKNNLYYLNKQGQAVDKNGHPLRKLSYAEAARAAVKNWLQSKGHRANLLGKYAYLGVGASEVVWSEKGIPQVYLVQNFGNKKL